MIFSIIRAALDYRGLPMAEKSVLVMLARCCMQRDGTDIYPGMTFLEEMTGASEWTIRRALKSLEGKGLITIEKRKQHRACYSLKLDNLGVRDEDKPIVRSLPQRQAERPAAAPPPTPQDSPAESLVEKYFPQLKEGYEPPPPPRSIVAMAGGTALAPIVLEGEPVPEERGRVALPQIAPLQPLADLTEARAMAQKTTLPEYQKWRRCQGVSALKAMNEYQRFNERIDG